MFEAREHWLDELLSAILSANSATTQTLSGPIHHV